MLVLGIETTCDETSCSVVQDGFKILSNVIATQIEAHKPFGGVVPELASRRHLDLIDHITQQALDEADVSIHDIDVIAVAKGPGLIGALLVGIHYAKGLAYSCKIPLIGVNHIEAHLFAAMMSRNTLQGSFPALGVVLSGGHTSIVLIHDVGRYTLLGETADDAIGEAFDKVARILDLPYPGGPEIELLASRGSRTAYSFHKSCVKGRPLDFSFSGIKTKVLYTVRGNNLKNECPLTESERANIAASFQDAVFQDVLSKVQLAIQKHPVQALFFGGGVTRNKRLRELAQEQITLPIYWPQDLLCLDNGAMIAGLGYCQYIHKPRNDLYTIDPETRIPFYNT